MLEIPSYQLSLLGTEIAISGSGTNETTHRHIFFKEKIDTQAIGRLRPRQTVTKRSSFTIPKNAYPSFSAYSNKIVWSLEAELSIEESPDWCSSREIKIIFEDRN